MTMTKQDAHWPADFERLARIQQAWIVEHGGDLAGYIARYGDPGLEKCYGNGGTAIYRADCVELRRLLDHAEADLDQWRAYCRDLRSRGSRPHHASRRALPRHEQTIRLIYPEKRTVSENYILTRHADAVANGELPKGTDDVAVAIYDLEDLGHITVCTR